jgi:hypothetical protein
MDSEKEKQAMALAYGLLWHAAVTDPDIDPKIEEAMFTLGNQINSDLKSQGINAARAIIAQTGKEG